jgi:hypothetical protein
MALTWPLVKDGSTGENVRSVQYLVTAHGHPTGVDGIFGPLTEAAVEAFQTSQGLGVDGEVGNQTWPKLIVQVASGSHGDAVKAVQDQIHNRGDGHVLAVDGIFGPDTDNAVRSFQSFLGLTVDGIVGPVTWNHLANGYLNAPGPQAAATSTFDAWKAHNEASAGKNATPGAVTQLFTQTWSASAGWAFENCQGAAGHTFCSWRRNSGKELRLGVQNAVSGPFYVVDSATFT